MEDLPVLVDNTAFGFTELKSMPVNWIDFVLDGTKLLPYLQANSESTNVELLESFILKVPMTSSSTSNTSDPESMKDSASTEPEEFPKIESSHTSTSESELSKTEEEILKKSRILKTLAFRTAAFLNWNLDVLSGMSIECQFIFITYMNEAFGQTNLFCRTLFGRWMLKALTLDPKSNPVSSLSMESQIVIFDDLKIATDELEKSKSDPSYAKLSIPSFGSIKYDWTFDPDQHLELPASRFLPCLYYHLGLFALHFHQIEDRVAIEYFRKLDVGGIQPCPFFSIPLQKVTAYKKLLGISKINKDEELKLKSLTTPSRQYEKHIVSQAAVECDFSLPTLSSQREIETTQSDLKFIMIDELIKASNPREIESLIFHINRHPKVPKRPISFYYPVDVMSHCLRTAISTLEPGPFQDILFARVANGLRLLEMNRFVDFANCLRTVQTSISLSIAEAIQMPNSRCVTTSLRKLEMMVGWEILLGDSKQAFLNWTSPQVVDMMDELVERCEDAIKIFLSIKAHARPRSEVVEAALIVLLNRGKFELVVNCSRARQGWPFLEFLTLVGRICINVQNGSYFSSNFRDVWNAILPILSTSTGVKRQPQAADGVLVNLTALKWILAKAKSPSMVKIFVSVLAKLHNFVTRDECGDFVQVELLEQWPNFLDEVYDYNGTNNPQKVAGTSKLNILLIRELLIETLEYQQGPDELYYLKIRGHVHLIANRHFMAMKCYVEYFVRSTQSFDSDSSLAWKDDELFRRMIRASSLLGSYLQAAILCQFLSIPDYTNAFGMASETNSTEDWIALVEFIWDQSILEYIINFYSKRKAYSQRCSAAIRMIRQLELNEHNNAEMKRAAIRIRKTHFMRTLANIYLLD